MRGPYLVCGGKIVRVQMQHKGRRCGAGATVGGEERVSTVVCSRLAAFFLHDVRAFGALGGALKETADIVVKGAEAYRRAAVSAYKYVTRATGEDCQNGCERDECGVTKQAYSTQRRVQNRL